MSMRKTREVLRLYFELKLKQRQIARSANVSQSTMHEYLERFRAAGLNWPLPAEMSETDLEGKLFPDDTGVSRPGEKTPPDFAYIHQQLQGYKVRQCLVHRLCSSPKCIEQRLDRLPHFAFIFLEFLEFLQILNCLRFQIIAAAL
jgi:hypothetical protein